MSHSSDKYLSNRLVERNEQSEEADKGLRRKSERDFMRV